METKPYSLQSPEALAKEYGGNKRKIAEAAQMGIVDPTAAVLAGMFIDRMRGAQMQEQAPQQTVAQEVLAAQPQMPQGAPQMGGGLEALPVPEEMFGAPGMASGGLVAFAEAGRVGMDALEEQRRKDLERARRESGILGLLLPDELAEDRASSPGEFPGRRQQMPVVSGMEEYGISPDTMVPRETTPYVEQPIKDVIQDIRSSIETGPYADVPTEGRGARTEAPGQPTPATPADIAAMANLGLTPKGEMPPAETPSADMVDATARALANAEAAAGPRRDSGGVNRSRAQAPAQESALDRYAQMLLGSMQDKDAAREDARNMALLQAGLGIMGGTSPYALQNIGAGALPATQAYQQQMQQMREDERKTVGALADLELKAQELGLTEKRYNDLVRIAEMQVAAAANKSTGVSAKDVAKMKSDIVTDLTKDGLVSTQDAILQADQIVNYALGLGGPTAGGRPTIKWGSIQ